jgi:hypothetical protein
MHENSILHESQLLIFFHMKVMSSQKAELMPSSSNLGELHPSSPHAGGLDSDTDPLLSSSMRCIRIL